VLLLGCENWPNLDELLEPEKAHIISGNVSDWSLVPFHNAKTRKLFLDYRTNPWLLIGWILVSIGLAASAPATLLLLF
jgi:hypothetical protein